MERCSYGLAGWSLKELNNEAKKIKDLLGDHPISCSKMIQ